MRSVPGKEFLDIQAVIEHRFDLKVLRDMIITCSQMHCTAKHSQLNYWASLAKWLSVRLPTDRLWDQTPLILKTFLY